MKFSLRPLFLCAAAFSFTLAPAIFAQDSKPSDPAAEKAPAADNTPAVAAPTAAEKSPAQEPAAPAVTPAPAEPAAVTPPSDTDVQAKDEEAAPSKMRRLDNVNEDDESLTPKSHKDKVREHIQRAHQRKAAVRANRVDRDIVNIFRDSFLEKGDKVDNVTAVFGSATAEGEVTDSVVAVFGNSRASGPVGDTVVAVLGDSEVTGVVGDSTVVVLGNLSVNSHVKGDVVTVLGDIKFGPLAEVDGDVVCVGGTVTKEVGANLHHSPQKVGIGFMQGGAGLKAWFRQCFMYARPLAFGADLMWAWWIALACLAFYVVVALIFGKGVNKCVDTLEQRPGFSILTALLALIIGPVLTIVLAITGIGFVVIPFLSAALFFASLFGKVVMRAWLGRRFSRFLGSDHPALTVLLGGVLVLLLYTVPIVGFILYALLGWIGLGVVIYTLVLAMKREKPPVPPMAPIPPLSPISSVPPIPPVVLDATGAVLVDPVTGSVPLAASPVAASPVVPPPMVPPMPMVPPVMAALTLPRAGFWIRLAALLLDVILVAIVCKALSGVFFFSPHFGMRADLLPALALYGALMWKLRGTTIGGIICGLKVVRLDGRPLDWVTAIVRALSCFLSLFVMGLGFIWVVFDDQRQSWHDKIAGTTVVRVPKGVSLV